MNNPIQNPQPIQPVPPQQPQTNQPQAAPQKSNKKIWLIIALVGCLPLLVIAGILISMVIISLGSARNKATDARIKSDIQEVKVSAAVYGGENSSYIGWQPSQQLASDVQANGSKLNTQSLSQDGYVIYAQISNGASIFCVDATGFNGEIKTVLPTQKTCQK